MNAPIADIFQFLTVNGYTNYGPTRHGADLTPTLFQKRIDASPCHQNDRTHISAWVYDERFNDYPIDTVTIEITGNCDPDDNWVKLEFYNISRDDLTKSGVLQDYESRLIAAWEALYLPQWQKTPHDQTIHHKVKSMSIVGFKFDISDHHTIDLFRLSRERAETCFQEFEFWPRTPAEAAFEAFIASNESWPSPDMIGISINRADADNPEASGFDATSEVSFKVEIDIVDRPALEVFLDLPSTSSDASLIEALARQVIKEITERHFKNISFSIDGQNQAVVPNG